MNSYQTQKEEIYTQLKPIMEEIFDEEDIAVSGTLTAAEVENWDSMTHILFIVEVESEFSVKFNTTEIESLRDIGHLAQTILEKQLETA